MLPSDCQAGITKYSGNENHQIISQASYSSYYYHDLYFEGTFCPKENGMYRIIFDGSIHERYESLYSSYTFNSIQHNSRISPYYYLWANTCYPYYIIHSIDGMYNIYGILYFQKKNNSKVVMTSEYSYSCQKFICLYGSKDPQCFKFKTNNLFYPSCKLLFFIIFLILNKG